MMIKKRKFIEGEIKKMNSFRIKNVKSFVDSGKIELKPITIFVGKNSCGKSSLLRFPIVLAQTQNSNTESPLRFYGKMIDYGNYEDVICGRREGKIEFEIHYEIDITNVRDSRHRLIFEDNEQNDTGTKRDTWMRVVLNKIAKKISVDEVELYVEEKCLSGFYREEDEYRMDVNYVYKDGDLVEERYSINVEHIEFETFFPFYDSRESFSAMAGLALNEDKSPVDAEVGQEMYNNIFNNANPFEPADMNADELKIKKIYDAYEYASAIMSHIYRNFMIEARCTTYIGPFRENPERVYRDSEAQSLDVGVKGENVSTLLIRDFQSKSKLIDGISKWLHSTMGYKLSLKDMGNNLFQIVLINDEEIESNILDVGFGISQILPIVTQIIRTSISDGNRIMGKIVNEQSLYIEQPELHLHPAAQAELADLFVDCVCSKKGQKLIIETHSEHLIRKLQVLIAESTNDFTNDMIKIYYVDKDEKGVATVSEMKLLENGKFKNTWPSGFFDKAHLLSMELLKATN